VLPDGKTYHAFPSGNAYIKASNIDGFGKRGAASV